MPIGYTQLNEGAGADPNEDELEPTPTDDAADDAGDGEGEDE